MCRDSHHLVGQAEPVKLAIFVCSLVVCIVFLLMFACPIFLSKYFNGKTNVGNSLREWEHRNFFSCFFGLIWGASSVGSNCSGNKYLLVYVVCCRWLQTVCRVLPLSHFHFMHVQKVWWLLAFMPCSAPPSCQVESSPSSSNYCWVMANRPAAALLYLANQPSPLHTHSLFSSFCFRWWPLQPVGPMSGSTMKLW